EGAVVRVTGVWRCVTGRRVCGEEEHGSFMILPRPWQEGHVRSMVKKPCEARTLPAPAQVGHEEGWVPLLAPVPEQVSHVTLVGTRICAVLPAKASGSEISML